MMNWKSFLQRNKKLLVVFGVVLSSVFTFGFADDYFEVSKNLEIFTTLYRELNIYYVDETKPGELMKKGIDAMLKTLDPYTQFIPEADIEDYRFMTTGQYGGIGSLIRMKDENIIISEPYDGFPAQKAGLVAGDIIREVDGVSTEGKNTSEVSDILKGQAGTTVSIKIERPGKEQWIEKTIAREKIKIPDVSYFGEIKEGVGYIRLNSFTETASGEVKKAFKTLKEEDKIQKLVLDLRGNGGGLLREAVNIVNFFVPKGQEVVSTKGRIRQWDQVHRALNQPLDTVMPLVILVDRNSASASEIVSGAIQDLDRGVVVGERTFGKGLVQQTKDLYYNAKLKLTVAKYYIPSGRCIQKLDYSHRNEGGKVEEVPDSLLKAFTTLNGRKVIDGRGIEPDVVVEERVFSKLTASLVTKSLIFDYATLFRSENLEIAAARDFRVDDGIYQNFTNYLEGKDYSYTTDTEELFEELKLVAESENYYQDVANEFQLFEKSLAAEKKDDLVKYKKEVKEVLENEIVSRYYYQRGRIEASFSHDAYLNTAYDVLNEQRYAQILSPVEEDKKN